MSINSLSKRENDEEEDKLWGRVVRDPEKERRPRSKEKTGGAFLDPTVTLRRQAHRCSDIAEAGSQLQ